jgi:hypothetical protein
MAVGANTYGTVARMEALIGDLVDSRAFSTSTTPKLAQVEVLLDDVASEINVLLEEGLYAIPVAVADDPVAHAYLVSINSFGAAVLVLGTLPEGSFAEEGDGRAATYAKAYSNGLMLIRRQGLKAARAENRFARTFAGSQEDSDGNKKLPIFKRGRFDYPGSRGLTEDT